MNPKTNISLNSCSFHLFIYRILLVYLPFFSSFHASFIHFVHNMQTILIFVNKHFMFLAFRTMLLHVELLKLNFSAI
ncbi:hypothetical protein Sjap_024066 [Stephania japonica]|uniref:Uncharacterized protein n=1 Tax=Stephania japonica TaxID=461633 RepID=A0AAP0ECW6_9MAGN